MIITTPKNKSDGSKMFDWASKATPAAHGLKTITDQPDAALHLACMQTGRRLGQFIIGTMATPPSTSPQPTRHPALALSSKTSHHRFIRGLVDGLRHRCEVPANAKLLIACSGGVDSVALLCGLAALNTKRGFNHTLAVAHVHHHLRADGSADADAAFVEQLAAQLHLPCFRFDLDPAQRPASKAMQNDEAWARHARYAALTRLAQTHGMDHIATAHHEDDQIETILMRLTRGTGLHGLAGIAWSRPTPTGAWDASNNSEQNAQPGSTPPTETTSPKPDDAAGDAVTSANAIRIVRPMLGVSRADAVDFLATLNQPARTDPTNHDTTRTRARLRQDVVPILKDLQPALGPVIQKLCDQASPRKGDMQNAMDDDAM